MGKARPGAVVLDTGALLALERAAPRMRALLREALQLGTALVIPVGVLGQAWRGSARQAPIAALLKAPTTEVEALDAGLAKAVGVLCGRRGTSDVVDASVVLAARRRDAPIVTSDPDDLLHLDPSLELHDL